MSNRKKSISIIGGGASALSMASFLDGAKFDVTIYERNKALGRKFLVAGKGGFNLTHSDPISDMITKYSPLGFLDESLLGFDNTKFRIWLESIGIPTYVGSSRRVFPEVGIKPIEVLAKIRDTITDHGHKLELNRKWTGWSGDGNILMDDLIEVRSDITVFCLGGSSWQVTGSDGGWNSIFQSKGISVNPFVAANCAYEVDWDRDFIIRSAGKPIKNVAITCDGTRVEGEAMISEFGLEGSAVYALTNQVQSQISNNGFAKIELDLKPMFSLAEIKDRLEASNRKITDALSKDLKLEKVKVKLLKSLLTKDEFLDLSILAMYVKSLPIHLKNAAPIDQAISTTGGIDIGEVDSYFQLRQMPNNYVIGEMLDWNAPTGGYLLQACFSMGHYLASHLNKMG